jgi:hypothetical protein
MTKKIRHISPLTKGEMPTTGQRGKGLLLDTRDGKSVRSKVLILMEVAGRNG